MNRAKAVKRIRRKLTRAKPCPFCGRFPEFDVRCRQTMGTRSHEHVAVRKGCCPPTALGQVESFYAERPNYGLWWRMANRLINDWNERQNNG